MKLSKLFTIIFILIAIGATTPIMAQSIGGRKREHRNQRRGGVKLFKRQRSAGNADAFARGGHKRGFIARIFKGNKDGSAWVYRKTNPGTKQKREQAQLFKRNRTKAKKYRDGILARQNHKRSSTRVRGNASFSKKKH